MDLLLIVAGGTGAAVSLQTAIDWVVRRFR
jgi:hypothetical protein